MEDNASKFGQFFKNFETLKSLTSSQTKNLWKLPPNMVLKFSVYLVHVFLMVFRAILINGSLNTKKIYMCMIHSMKVLHLKMVKDLAYGIPSLRDIQVSFSLDLFYNFLFLISNLICKYYWILYWSGLIMVQVFVCHKQGCSHLLQWLT